jgi:cysteine desulfurase NifS
MLRLALDGSGYTPEDIREAGGWVRIPVPMLEYKKWQKGGLRQDGQPGFETPTGKFEIWSTTLEEYGYEPLPKYVEPKEGPIGSPTLAEEFPLVFNSGARTRTDFRSQHHGIDGLVKEHPEPTVEINSENAAERNIVSCDLVNVVTLRGSVAFRALVTDDIVKGTIECSMGGGTPVGPEAWQERNVNELTDLENFDEISGFPVYKALLCEVVKVASGKGGQGTIPETRKKQKKSTVRVGSKRQKQIYLDNNATTPVAEAVREAMLPYLGADYGNPSSIHTVGREARAALEKARRQVASIVNASPRRVIFTGSGSEADNLALVGAAYARRDKGNHVITTTIEHPAVLKTAKFLEKSGFRVTYLEVDGFGCLETENLREAIADDTILVSIMLANNEVGTILPVRELCNIAHEKGIPFHTDAVQAIGKIKVDVEELGIDLLSISGHKFGAPKGVGALYIRKGVEIEPLIHGGQQESGFRAGTENVPSIVGLGKAAEMAAQTWQNAKRIAALRDRLEKRIKELIPYARLNGHPISRLPNTLNMTLPELRGESIVIAMDRHGIALSSGSACKSGSPEPTHVLIAMGRTEEEAHCSVRFSLSHNTTGKDIDDTVDALKQILEEKDTIRLIPCK